MSRDVYVCSLGMLASRPHYIYAIGAQIKKHFDVPCVTESGWGPYARPHGTATVEELDRWRAATEDLRTSMHELQDKARQASLHLFRPHCPPDRNPELYRLWCHVRYAKRNRLLRKDYARRTAELLAEFEDALAAYQARAGDLPAYLAEHRKQEDQRLEKERKERELAVAYAEAHKEAQARLRRAPAMEAAAEPRWAYEIHDLPDGDRVFRIYLSSLDHSDGPGGLTPAEVHTALLAERAQYPYTWVLWGEETGQALRDKYRTSESGWQALTGDLIDPHPRDPSKPQVYPRYGGTTYGSMGVGGFH